MEQIVELTEKALHQVREIAKNETDLNNRGLRLGVMGGGCSGSRLFKSVSFFAGKIKNQDLV